jgi:hypothetical protein
VRRREGGEKTCNHKTKGTRAAFVRLKKINARVKKSEGVRVRTRQKRERERENIHTHHHGRILRRGGPPSAVHVFLYGKEFLSKTLIF